MASYFDVFISGSPKDNEIFPSGDDKARMYLEKFFNISEDECHNYDFYVDALVHEKVVYYSLLFRRNVVGTRTNGYFALTIRMNGGYHLNIKLMQNVLYHIYERYIEGKIIEEKEENKIKSYKYKVESLSKFFANGNKESIENYLNESFKDTQAQFGNFESNKILFSKTPSGNRNLYVTSTNNNILLNELAKTWTLHTYSDYDKNKELESRINSLETKLGEAQSDVKIKGNQITDMNSKLVSLNNDLTALKSDRDEKARDLESEKKKNEQLEKENKELKNNPKNSFEKDVRDMLKKILEGQELILNNKGNTVTQIIEHKKHKKEQGVENKELVEIQAGEGQKSGNVKFSSKLIISWASWAITVVSVIGVLVMGVISGDTEDVEKLQNDLAQAKETISDQDNDIQNYKSENKKLTDSLNDYRKKIADIGGVLKVENKSSQAKSLASNYKPSIGSKSDKKFKVGTSYSVSFKNGAKYEWSVTGEGAEKEEDKVKIISKKPFAIVVKDNEKEVYRRDVYETEIVEK